MCDQLVKISYIGIFAEQLHLITKWM